MPTRPGQPQAFGVYCAAECIARFGRRHEKLTGGTSGGDSSEKITDIYERAARQSPFIKDELIVRDLNFGACEETTDRKSVV